MTSDPYACTPGRYMNSLAQAWLGRHWFILIIPLIAFGIWTFFDLRALYLLAIVIFLIYPSVITTVWLSYSLSPNSIRAIRTKIVTITSDNIIVDYPCSDDDNSRPLPSETIKIEDIIDIQQTSGGLMLITGARLDERLLLPSDAFNPTDWNKILQLFDDRFKLVEP